MVLDLIISIFNVKIIVYFIEKIAEIVLCYYRSLKSSQLNHPFMPQFLVFIYKIVISPLCCINGYGPPRTPEQPIAKRSTSTSSPPPPDDEDEGRR